MTVIDYSLRNEEIMEDVRKMEIGEEVGSLPDGGETTREG